MKFQIEYDPKETDKSMRWFICLLAKDGDTVYISTTFHGAMKMLAFKDFDMVECAHGGYRFTLKDSARDTQAMQRCNLLTVAE